MQLLAPALSKGKRGNDTLCHQCGKIGHIKRDWKEKRFKNAKQENETPGYVQNAKKEINGQINTDLNIIKMGHSQNVMWGLA